MALDSMLSAFKIKEFDLQPIFEEWKDAPVFNGNAKKDLPVEEWLEKIKEGCEARNVPEEYWYKVAQHYLGPKAKARLDELKQVISKVHGSKYRWTWKKFKVAMLNMGWTIDKDKKETIKVQGRSSGMWFTRRKDTDTASVKDMPHDPPASSSGSQRKPKPQTRPPISRSGTILMKRHLCEEPEELPEISSNKKSNKGKEGTAPRGRPVRSASVSSLWSSKASSTSSVKDKEAAVNKVPQRPGHQKARSETTVMVVKKRSASPAESVHSEGAEVVTTKAEAPAWLLNACNALEFITSEHPKAMSVISAILITAGSIPAIPAIAAGAGGAVLASSAAHAIGAIAVAAGQALSAGVAVSKNKEQQGIAAITDGH